MIEKYKKHAATIIGGKELAFLKILGVHCLVCQPKLTAHSNRHDGYTAGHFPMLPMLRALPEALDKKKWQLQVPCLRPAPQPQLTEHIAKTCFTRSWDSKQ